MRSFEAVVIGAGPAGLSAAAELSRAGTCLLLEQGPLAVQRNRAVPRDLLAGVGGAGLFSDGKHSFFPSASALWRLPDAHALEGAFARTAALLRAYGVEAGAFPRESAPSAEPGLWSAKHYPSLYVPFAQRQACIETLWAAAGERWPGARVVAAGRSGAELVLEVERAGGRVALRTQRLVVAAGRWAPRLERAWLEQLGVRFALGRAEFGVRLEGSADEALFALLPGVDGKVRFAEPGRAFEARTFCTCREGEVVLGEAGGLRAYSGRADGPRTGRSSVGLLVRTLDARLSPALEAMQPVAFPLEAWPGPLPALFGAAGAEALSWALGRLLAPVPEVRRSAFTVYAPCIEGVGDYPVDDGSLQVAPGVWVAGDAIGRFRGIVASMVSGRYAAARITAGTR